MSGVVVIGASLGGLNALTRLLSQLPADFAAPILIVQHRRADETSRLAALLDRRTPLEVLEPDDKQKIEPGYVYVAPADYHLLINGTELALAVEEPVCFARPSIDVLFESAAESAFDPVVGVLLTASSDDGAQGIAKVAGSGGITIVQDPNDAESGIAARAALARTRVDHVVPLVNIPDLLVRIFKKRKTP